MFYPPRWEEEEAGGLAPAVKTFTSQSRWVTSVVHVVPYVRVQVSTAQLGVACLLGLRWVLYNRHEAGNGYTNMRSGGIFGLAKATLFPLGRGCRRKLWHYIFIFLNTFASELVISVAKINCWTLHNWKFFSFFMYILIHRNNTYMFATVYIVNTKALHQRLFRRDRLPRAFFAGQSQNFTGHPSV